MGRARELTNSRRRALIKMSKMDLDFIKYQFHQRLKPET